MKKLSVLFIIGIVCISSMAKAWVPDYVICDEGMKVYEKVRYSLTGGLVGIDESGRTRYKAGEVVAFRKDGSVYERMPVILDNKETGRYDFMEVIGYRSGLKLYRHITQEGPSLTPRDQYLVFREGKYVVSYDEKNFKSLNNFFSRSGMPLLAGE